MTFLFVPGALWLELPLDRSRSKGLFGTVHAASLRKEMRMSLFLPPKIRKCSLTWIGLNPSSHHKKEGSVNPFRKRGGIASVCSSYPVKYPFLTRKGLRTAETISDFVFIVGLVGKFQSSKACGGLTKSRGRCPQPSASQ